MYLKSVDVTGFWGRADVHVDLRTGVNIFIGSNGSGKTTLINIINAVLTADLAALESLDFEVVKICFTSEVKGPRTLRVVRANQTIRGAPYPYVTYKLGNNGPMELPLGMRYRDRAWSRGERATSPNPAARALEDLRLQLTAMADIRWLSVHRYAASDSEDKPRMAAESAVDAKLFVLQNELARYQLTLEMREGEVTKDFQKEVFGTMLYNPDFDSFDMSRSKVDLNKIDIGSDRAALEKAFEELGMPKEEAERRIGQHIDALERSIATFRKFQRDKKTPLTIDDVLPYSLARRSWRIIELANAVEEKRNAIQQKRNEFCRLASAFLIGKEVHLGEGGGLAVRLSKNNADIPVVKLSSGEKQLLIQLLEALIQDQKPCVFIADEPELSLHVKWQLKLLGSMTDLNPNAQVIVATHSPEIVGDFGDRVIKMENIVHERDE